jgi:CO/xanthine dehydrogenase Mo-binding subunit
LGIPSEQIKMVTGDTALIGDSGPASASRLTLFAGNAVRQAAELALQKWQSEERPAVGECRWNAPPTTAPDPETGACINSISFSYGAQMAEVEVDLETGQISLLRVIAVHDPGRAVNPQQVVGQIEGGVIQAQGWALIEDFVTEGGYVLTDRLSTYLIPTVLDIPADMRSVLIEKNDPIGPFGVRGVGEIPFIPLAPAIVCAVHDALGVWFDSIPLKPERVLLHLKKAST